jgi:hypothetical protein
VVAAGVAEVMLGAGGAGTVAVGVVAETIGFGFGGTGG